MTTRLSIAAWALPLIFILSSCSSNRGRFLYDLSNFDDLIVSNSENSPSSPKKIGAGEIQINHTLLISNSSSSREYDIRTSQSSFSLVRQTASTPADCNQGQDIKLHPGEKARIDCTVVITADLTNHLATRDTNGTFKIPYSFDGSAADAHLESNYDLRIEDFQ